MTAITAVFTICLPPDQILRLWLHRRNALLYFRAGLQLYTEALAGTVANYPEDDRAAQAAQWLLADKRMCMKTGVVVDDICQRRAVSALDVSAAAVIRLRKVQHLYRVISATLYAP